MLNLPDLNVSIVRDQLLYGIKVEVQKTALKKIVLGVSGGIDSALPFALAVEALGKENVHAILLPYNEL